MKPPRSCTIAPLLAAILILASTAFSAPAPSRTPVEKLREAALGPDIAAARAAIQELHAMGNGPRRLLIDTLRQVLARDKNVIEKAAGSMPDAAKIAAIEDSIAKERSAALANIKVLDKGRPVDEAKDHFTRLMDLVGQLNQINAHRASTADALARRKDFLAMFRGTAPATDTAFNQAAEARLIAQAEKILGIPAATAAAIPSLGEVADRSSGAPPVPKDGIERSIWFYRACRQIEAYNQSIQDIADPEEFENLRLVNQYRECLGILPYELDPRLTQSARRHSKEMVDLNYFAHESPTAAERSHIHRMKNAGYDRPYSENIAMGPATGEKAFWMWFGSPPHHTSMVAAGCTGMGVGRWNNRWTQNMGNAKRLMLLSADQRQAVKINGTFLAPDAPAAKGRGR